MERVGQHRRSAGNDDAHHDQRRGPAHRHPSDGTSRGRPHHRGVRCTAHRDSGRLPHPAAAPLTRSEHCLMRRNLSGRKLVITGAARGIGEKAARLAAARGAHVALIGLEPGRLRALADDRGAVASWQEADVRDGIALRSAIDNCAMTMGGIDIVVANAGVAAYGTVRQADEASFERVLDINLKGVFRTLKYATPHLERSRGHAMVLASAISFTPIAGLASYAASKAGVEMLALAYRQEVAHIGITVGLVHPSWIDT